MEVGTLKAALNVGSIVMDCELDFLELTIGSFLLTISHAEITPGKTKSDITTNASSTLCNDANKTRLGTKAGVPWRQP